MFNRVFYQTRWIAVVMLLIQAAPLWSADVNLDAAREGYNTTLSRMHSLWTVTRHDLTPGREGVSPVVNRRLEWAYEGKKQYTLWHNAPGPGAITRVIRWSRDEKTAWSHFAADREPYDLRAVFYGPAEKFENPAFSREDGVPRILGLGFGIGGPGGASSIHSLTTLLNTADAAFLDFEEIGGSRCYKIRAGYLVFGPTDDRVEITAWFDPAADWWPRKIQSNGYGTSEREVTEFQRVTLGVGPETLSFPKSATLLVPGAWRTLDEVQEVRINQPIDPMVFTPKIPKGVERISSEDTQAGQDFLKRYTEQSPSIQQLKALEAHALANQKQTEIPVGLESLMDARPLASFGWSAIFVLGALVLLAAASILALRAKAA